MHRRANECGEDEAGIARDGGVSVHQKREGNAKDGGKEKEDGGASCLVVEETAAMQGGHHGDGDDREDGKNDRNKDGFARVSVKRLPVEGGKPCFNAVAVKF